MSEPKIIHKDDEMIVIDKPAGVPSVSLKSGEKDSLAAWLIKKFPKQAQLPNGELEAGLVHRLDNDTSGVIVVARTKDAFENLRKQFDEDAVKKVYTALVVGAPLSNGEIDTPIAHHPKKKKKMIVCGNMKEFEEYKGRDAHTEYKLIKKYEIDGEKYALLSIKIKKGARHQIRVHLASIGLPLAGDKLYQNPKMRLKDKLKLKRHFLHSSKITLKHPATGKPTTFASELPEDLTIPGV